MKVDGSDQNIIWTGDINTTTSSLKIYDNELYIVQQSEPFSQLYVFNLNRRWVRRVIKTQRRFTDIELFNTVLKPADISHLNNCTGTECFCIPGNKNICATPDGQADPLKIDIQPAVRTTVVPPPEPGEALIL